MPYLFYYLMQVTICSAVLFGYYYFFLRNKVYHHYNRFYLLAAVALSLICPLFNFAVLLNPGTTAAAPIQVLQVVTDGRSYIEEMIAAGKAKEITLSQVLLGLYMLVSLVMLSIMITLFARIYRLLKSSVRKKLNDIVFVPSEARGTPFSFFSFIFWNKAIDLDSPTGKQIFAHEVAHVREKHSADKLFLNLALIPCWLNPIFWLIKRELNLIHEFIADKKAVQNNDTTALAAMIVTAAYPQHSFLPTNHFFYSPIKRRLQMLSKYNSKKAGYFYRVLALPVILILLAAFGIRAKSEKTGLENPAEKITVVIDAGHGGHDGGATAADGITKEKDMALAYTKAIRDYNQLSNVNIILSRESDVYQHPREKAAFARTAGADLFISVHMSSARPGFPAQNGMEVYVAKDEYRNSAASKLFASAVINQFKTNYGLTVPSNPIQRPTGVFVLQDNEFPSILIEAGYLTYSKDLAYLNSNQAKEQFAKNIVTAIVAYAKEKGNTKAPVAMNVSYRDTVPAKKSGLGTYLGQKIRQIRAIKNQDLVMLTLEDGTKVNMTFAEAEKLDLLPPPPPPPPAPPVLSDLAPVPPMPPAPPAKTRAAGKLAPLPPVPPMPPTAPLAPIAPVEPVKNININSNVDVVLKATNDIKSDVKVNLTSAAVTMPVHLHLQPIIFLDGVEIAYDDMNKINPNMIKSVNVLKGTAAVQKYGADKSVNGVIEISTKINITINPAPVKEVKLTNLKTQ